MNRFALDFVIGYFPESLITGSLVEMVFHMMWYVAHKNIIPIFLFELDTLYETASVYGEAMLALIKFYFLNLFYNISYNRMFLSEIIIINN